MPPITSIGPALVVFSYLDPVWRPSYAIPGFAGDRIGDLTRDGDDWRGWVSGQLFQRITTGEAFADPEWTASFTNPYQAWVVGMDITAVLSRYTAQLGSSLVDPVQEIQGGDFVFVVIQKMLDRFEFRFFSGRLPFLVGGLELGDQDFDLLGRMLSGQGFNGDTSRVQFLHA